MKITSRIHLCTLLTALALGFTSSAFADENHTKKAIEHLESAKAQLVESDKGAGGHRAKAIKMIDDVIQEVKEGRAVRKAKK